MIRRWMFTSLSAVTMATTVGTPAFAECPGLPDVTPPKLETCSKGFFSQVGGMVGLGCEGRNKTRQRSYDRMTRGFASGLTYKSSDYFMGELDKNARAVTLDSLRGCRGEDVNLAFTPGNVTLFEYDLTAPSGVMVSSHSY